MENKLNNSTVRANKPLEWGPHNPKLTDKNFIDRVQKDKDLTNQSFSSNTNEVEETESRAFAKVQR